MSSELLQAHPDPLAAGGRGGGGLTRRRERGWGRPAADDAAFAVDWQVRPGPAEPGRSAGADPAPPSPVTPTVRASGLSFDIARALGTVVVTARGRLDAAGSRALAHVLDDLIENQGNMAVVVDLHGVSDVDVGCLDVFVSAHGWAVIRGGELSLTGARLRLARALEETGVNRLVKVTSDRILAVPAPVSGVTDAAGGSGSRPFPRG